MDLAPQIKIFDSIAAHEVINFALNSNLQHLCQREGFASISEIQSASCIYAKPDGFLRSPILAILCPESAEVRSEREYLIADCSFKSSNQKADICNTFANAMREATIRGAVASDVISVVDEMFTNAVYHGPLGRRRTKEDGSPPDTVSFELDKMGRLFLAKDESRIVVGCVDPFGSLDVRHFLTKMHQVALSGSANSINLDSCYDGGLGGYMMFEFVSSLYVGVWKGSATILCGVIPYNLSSVRRVQLPKHLHLIER